MTNLSQMIQNKLPILLIVSLLTTLAGCGLTEWAKQRAIDEGSNMVAKQLPDQASIDAYNTIREKEGTAKALAFAIRVAGEEKIAKAMEEENAELAAQIRAGNLFAGGSVSLNAILAILSVLLKRKQSGVAGVLRTVIGAVEKVTEPEVRPKVLAAIKEQANMDGTREALTREVNKVVKKAA